jgi:hypothetical protein
LGCCPDSERPQITAFDAMTVTVADNTSGSKPDPARCEGTGFRSPPFLPDDQAAFEIIEDECGDPF